MTPEDQQLAIVRACGWKQEEVEDGLTFSEPKRLAFRKMWVLQGQLHTKTIRLPDYLSDLNACHEAIMAQPQEIRDKINHTLMESLRPNDAHILDRTINATAAQRCEAFLRTLNLWTE